MMRIFETVILRKMSFEFCMIKLKTQEESL